MPSDDRVLLLSLRTAGRSQLAAWLSGLGYAVAVAFNLAEAQAMWEHEAFVIVVVDSSEQRNLQVSIADVRAQMPSSRIIAIGRRKVADVLAAWHAGADDYLARPAHQHELASALERLQRTGATRLAEHQQALPTYSATAEFRRMAAELVQQINTPLIPILGMADLLAEDLPLDHPGRQYAREISEAAIRIRDITWKLADITQQDE